MPARAVVLVHGNPETAAIWGPLTDALRARGHDEIVPLSPPGFGAPVPDGFDPTMDSYADWLVRELESIRATGAEIDLLGHDWGAGHVYGALARRPELVRTWTGDIAGILHADYVWHDMAQAWQTPEVGAPARPDRRRRTRRLRLLGAVERGRRTARHRGPPPPRSRALVDGRRRRPRRRLPHRVLVIALTAVHSTGRPRLRAMTRRWISLVPSPTSRILASR